MKISALIIHRKHDKLFIVFPDEATARAALYVYAGLHWAQVSSDTAPSDPDEVVDDYFRISEESYVLTTGDMGVWHVVQQN